MKSNRTATVSEYVAAYSLSIAFTFLMATWISLRHVNETIGPFEWINKIVGEPFK